jgi:coronin-1B/1C/6
VLDLSEKEKEKAGGVKDLQPLARISTGTRKIGQIVFHPTAENVIAVSTSDHQVRLYDLTPILESSSGSGAVEQLAPKVTMTGPKDSIQAMEFDFAGDRLAVTSRDKQFRIYDARKGGEPILSGTGHEGVKGARVIWCGNSDRLVTTGFTRTSNRQMFLWDGQSLEKPIKALTLDTSSGVVMPFWSDNGIIYLAGKGDGNVRYYELENDDFFELAEHKSSEPQRGMTFVPRRALATSENEIARAYKVTGNMIQPIAFQVPRRAESFQADIFPPAPSAVAALSASDFFAGKRSAPNLVSLEDGKAAAAAPPRQAAPTSTTTPTPSQSAPPAASLPAPAPVPAAAPVERKLPEPTRAVEPIARPASPVKAAAAPRQNGHSEAATLAKETTPTSNTSREAPGSSDELKELQEEIETLKEEMAKRDNLIRKLEVENERLRANERRVREAIGSA